LKTKKLQANIEDIVLNKLNKLRKNNKIDRDTLLTVIIYEGIEKIKNLDKVDIIKRYIEILEKLNTQTKN
jgi:hypothetical protein